MKPLILAFALLCVTFSFGQLPDTILNNNKGFAEDSAARIIQYKRDSISKAIHLKDSILQQEQMEKNMNYILQVQKENRAKQKKAAIIRIAIGVGFLVLLIVGLRRRRKK